MRGSLEQGALIGWYLRDDAPRGRADRRPDAGGAGGAQRPAARARPRRSTARRSPIPTPSRARRSTAADERRDPARRPGGRRALRARRGRRLRLSRRSRDTLAGYLAAPRPPLRHRARRRRGGRAGRGGVHRHADERPVELYIDEVGVAPAYRRKGIARLMLDELFALARELGCAEAWVGTEADNVPATTLYESRGAAARAVRDVRLRALSRSAAGLAATRGQARHPGVRLRHLGSGTAWRGQAPPGGVRHRWCCAQSAPARSRAAATAAWP